MTKDEALKETLSLLGAEDKDELALSCRAPFRFSKRESLKAYGTEPEGIETNFTEEVGRAHLSGSATMPLTFKFKVVEEEDYEINANLVEEAWFVPSSGELDFSTHNVRTIRTLC
jgi:hypothetical protein